MRAKLDKKMAEREERHKVKEAAKQAAKAKIMAEYKVGDTAVKEAGETEAGPNGERERSPSVKSSRSQPR